MKKFIAVAVTSVALSVGVGVVDASEAEAKWRAPDKVMTRKEFNRVKVGDTMWRVKRKVGAKGRFERRGFYANVSNFDWLKSPLTQPPPLAPSQIRSFRAGKGKHAVRYPLYPNRQCRAYRITFAKALDGRWRVAEKHNWSNTC